MKTGQFSHVQPGVGGVSKSMITGMEYACLCPMDSTGREFQLKFDFLQQKNSRFIGVDISSSAVKMVELSLLGKRQYRLEGYASAQLPKEAISDGNVNDLNMVAFCVALARLTLASGGDVFADSGRDF